MDEARNRRYLAKVDQRGPDECWPWTACRNPFGYGTFRGITEQLAHRYGYRLHTGPIPEGMQVCHTCDNPPCQNPRHWFLGTHADNHADKMRKGRARTRPRPGSSNSQAKLTEDDAAAIRDRYLAGETQRALAAVYGVAQTTISKIVRGARWTSVPVVEQVPARQRPRPSGDQHTNTKIRDADVPAIIAAYAAGVTQQALADQYGVSTQPIRRILSGRRVGGH